MDGIHLSGERYGCPAGTPEFTLADALARVCVDAASVAGLTVVGERFFQFEPQGVTGTVLLAESHLAIHTWPEHGFVTIDVYVCNYMTDNTDFSPFSSRALGVAPKPARTVSHPIRRGGMDE